jgi:hypothetical protein
MVLAAPFGHDRKIDKTGQDTFMNGRAAFALFTFAPLSGSMACQRSSFGEVSCGESTFFTLNNFVGGFVGWSHDGSGFCSTFPRTS